MLVMLLHATAATVEEEEEEGGLSFPWSFASFLGLGVLSGRVVRGMAG